jgi:hypothetical protein
MTRFRLRSTAVVGALMALASASMLSAQTTVTIPPIDFSGVIYSNFQYRVDQRAKNTNNFNVERAYLTFRMPAGDRASIRITTDVYQQTNTGADAYYAGWAIRLKYAYLQYAYITGKATDFTAVARMGALHTVIIDHEEAFWPRWLSQTDVERAGMFSSADIGASTLMSLPSRWGEIYAAVTNGPGYVSRELDRFKDPQARLTLTPLANSKAGIFTTWAISPWIYHGLVASPFVGSPPPSATSNGPIGVGLDRDRWGVFTGIRDPRIQAGAQYTSFKGQSQTGANTPASPAVTVDSSGHIASGFLVVKPLALLDTGFTHLNLVARYDKVTTNTNYNPSAQYHVFIGGIWLDLNRRSAISVDYQEQLSDNYPVVNGATITPTQPLRQWFVHMVANF